MSSELPRHFSRFVKNYDFPNIVKIAIFLA